MTIHKIRILLLSALSVFVFFAAVTPAYAVDVIDPNLCNGALNPEVICKDRVDNPNDNPIYGPEGVLTRAIHILSITTAVISVIIIFIAGIRMSVSQGESQKVISARNTIIYAGVGLAVAAVAQAAVQLVLSKL